MRKTAFQHFPLHAFLCLPLPHRLFIFALFFFSSFVWPWQPTWIRCDDASEKLSANNEQKGAPELKYK